MNGFLDLRLRRQERRRRLLCHSYSARLNLFHGAPRYDHRFTTDNRFTQNRPPQQQQLEIILWQSRTHPANSQLPYDIDSPVYKSPRNMNCQYPRHLFSRTFPLSSELSSCMAELYFNDGYLWPTLFTLCLTTPFIRAHRFVSPPQLDL